MQTVKWAIGLILSFLPAVALAGFDLFPISDFGSSPTTREAAVYTLITLLCLMVVLGIAAILGTRSPRSVASVVLMFGLASTLVAFSVAMPWVTARSTPPPPHVYPPSLLEDQTAFARAFAQVHPRAASYPADLSGARRRHVFFDEYGLLKPGTPDFERRYRGWEEYGLPFRAFRIPYRFDEPRREAIVHLDRILLSTTVRPIHLFGSLLLTFFGIALIRIVAQTAFFLRWLRRARAGACVHCGYLLTARQSVCPECGRSVAQIDRLFVPDLPTGHCAD